jgi:hypothetical protein
VEKISFATSHLHYNEHSADDHTLHATAQNGIGHDGKSLVDNHIAKQEGDEEKVAILAYGDDLVCVFALLAVDMNGHLSHLWRI